MVLSNDLISQFVKTNKAKKEDKKETIVYGTIDTNDINKVIIDGSNISTPITKAVVAGLHEETENGETVSKGDRVIVTIKNHTAIVTSNLSSPSARVDDTVDISKLNASNARIDSLETANVKVQNTLTAQNAEIENLKANNAELEKLVAGKIDASEVEANYAKISRLEVSEGKIENLEAENVDILDRLTASEAAIKDLQAEHIDTETLNATYATIKNLDSTNANVNNLQATKADIVDLDAALGRIDTLESNSVTTTYLQSNYITANEIESTYVTATKLAAEYAKTTTLESDYAKINLANVDTAAIGTVLANAGLITTATIVDGHVTGYLDSVQINANDITAGTLTVDRLVISGTDKSIVYALNNTGDLTSTEVDTINGDVITKRTIAADHIIAGAITANELHSESVTSDKIASGAVTAGKINVTSLESIVAKIGSFNINNSLYSNNHSAYNTANNGVYIGSDYISLGNGGKTWLKNDGSVSIGDGAISYDAISGALDITASSIKMGSETVAMKSDVDNLQIGGRNLAVYKDFKPVYSNDTFMADYNTGLISAENFKWYFNVASVDKKLIPGQTYTLSNEYIRDTIYDNYVIVALYNYVTEQTYYAWSLYSGGSLTFTITDNIDTDNTSLYVYVATDTTATFEISKLKLEKGNKPTDWTPAPEDVTNNILVNTDELNTRLSAAEATITQHADSILLKAEKTYVDNTLTNYSTTSAMNAAINLKANAITSEVNSTINSLQIGGRNLIVYKDLIQSYSSDDFSADANTGIITSTSLRYYFKVANITGKLIPGQTYTLSNESIDSVNFGVDIRLYNLSTNTEYLLTRLTSGGSKTFTVPESVDVENTSLLIYPTYDKAIAFTINKLKLEKGSKATDWSPAPEDVSDQIISNRTLIEQTATDLTVKIESSAKTATNYLNFSSSGLVIGDLTSSTLGKNVLIDSDSVDIRNGNTTLASFGADYLYLAKSSRNAKIDLCNGLATLYHESKYSYDTMFIIDTGNTTEIMGLITPLCVTSVDDLDSVSIQFANANGVMGGVGIVGSWLRRFGSNMFDTYTILDSGNYFDVMDSGWFYTGGYGDNFTQYNNETHSKVRYRKVGGVVEVRGALKATTTIEGSDTKHTMFTLPEGYRPDCRIVQRCQGSGMHTWMLTVEESGAVTFSRYGVGTSYSDIGTTVWLPIQITFLVN